MATKLQNMTGWFAPRMLFLTPKIGLLKTQIQILDTTLMMYASTINGNYIMFGSCDMERQ